MQKIWAVSIVKNERDIIESFCRYTLSWCDGLLIRDDGSADNTKEIINMLMQEGLRIKVIKTPVSRTGGFGPCKTEALNGLARQAFEEYGADWAVPLDADEFIFCPDYSNPRAQLEQMDGSVEHRFYSRTYIFENPPSDDSVFLPFQFQSFLRNPREGRMAKTILSKKLYFERNARIATGHHHLAYASKPQPQIEFTDRLASAHFPFRSTEQMLAKVIVGELNYKASPGRNNCGLHWNLMYNAIKNQAVDAKLARRFSLFYSGIFETQADVDEPVVADPFRAGFIAEPIVLKYTNLEPGTYEYLDKILAGMESIIDNLKNTIEATGGELDQCRKRAAELKKHRFKRTNSILKFFHRLLFKS